MMKQTNLNQIKHQARVFLSLDPQLTEFSPVVVKHPFTDSGFVMVNSGDGYRPVDITKDSESLDQWRKNLSERIDNITDAKLIFTMLTKSYRFAFLKQAMPYMSRSDFSEYLANAWTSCEAPNADPNFTKHDLVELFRKAAPDFLMTADEYNAYLDLPDILTVYRGVTEDGEAQIEALSWTLDKDKAAWFAHRFGEDGTVYQAEIMKSNTYALFLGRGESEIIVNPKYLLDITDVDDINSDNEMGGLML